MSTNRSKIFFTTCNPYNLGTAFLVWSVYFVTQQKNFYSIKQHEVLSVPENPLLNGTAHKMESNTTGKSHDIKELIANFEGTKNLQHVRFFPHVNSLTQYNDENKKFQKNAGALGLKVINIISENSQGLISFLRDSYEDLTWQQDIQKVKKHCLRFWPSFLENEDIFLDKLHTWHDIRENIALNIRPSEYDEIGKDIEQSHNLHTCLIKQFLFEPKDEIIKILKFLDCKFDNEMVERWLTIHEQWSQNIKHYIRFCDDLDLIISNIIGNKSMSLQEYKMTVLKEAVLVHFLMYRYDLNLANKVEKLPGNTADIHNLLHANTRTGIQKIY